MVTVTKTWLPPLEEYTAILQRAWQKGWITNNGMLLRELEASISEYLQAPHFLYCSNGTVVLQMAMKALGISGEIITTPFSYVATANAIAWEGCQPVFADIDAHALCIDPDAIEAAITPNTKAILATHVYGMPCDVDAIGQIARKHHLPVIFDAAHAFGCSYRGQSLLLYGTAATCSFHATKLFHTVEGGGIVWHDPELARLSMLQRQFGHIGEDEYYTVGINAKNSEMHAAMGLAILPHVSGFIAERKALFERYRQGLSGSSLQLLQPERIEGFSWNYAYCPAIFRNHEFMLQCRTALEASGIFTRRYFYPALNTLPQFGSYQSCPVAEDVASRVLCLPMFNGLLPEQVDTICDIVNQTEA
jgi:dTDP-4-amino-4,6-dideoxygalactose transaminase